MSCHWEETDVAVQEMFSNVGSTSLHTSCDSMSGTDGNNGPNRNQSSSSAWLSPFAYSKYTSDSIHHPPHHIPRTLA